jgi:hypothetical protein
VIRRLAELPNLLHLQAARRQRADRRLGLGGAEPGGPLVLGQDDDLAVVVGGDVGAGLAGQHGEAVVARQAGDGEQLSPKELAP